MSKPVTYKPWIDGRGQPVMVSVVNGDFVAKSDYELLEKMVMDLNPAKAAAAGKETNTTAEDANGDDKS